MQDSRAGEAPDHRPYVMPMAGAIQPPPASNVLKRLGEMRDGLVDKILVLPDTQQRSGASCCGWAFHNQSWSSYLVTMPYKQ